MGKKILACIAGALLAPAAMVWYIGAPVKAPKRDRAEEYKNSREYRSAEAQIFLQMVREGETHKMGAVMSLANAFSGDIEIAAYDALGRIGDRRAFNFIMNKVEMNIFNMKSACAALAKVDPNSAADRLMTLLGYPGIPDNDPHSWNDKPFQYDKGDLAYCLSEMAGAKPKLTKRTKYRLENFIFNEMTRTDVHRTDRPCQDAQRKLAGFAAAYHAINPERAAEIARDMPYACAYPELPKIMEIGVENYDKWLRTGKSRVQAKHR